MHSDRSQKDASFEYGDIFGRSLHQGLSRGLRLDGDSALIFAVFFQNGYKGTPFFTMDAANLDKIDKKLKNKGNQLRFDSILEYL